MTDLNTLQLQWLRDELGSQPDDAALQERYDALGSVRDVAIAVLRGRRADLLRKPLTTTVSGVASVNYAENVKAIERRISALERLDDDPTDTPGEDVDGGAGGDHIEAFQLVRSRGR
jgi:hypothetical protein